LAAHSRQGTVARDEQIACLGSAAGEMRHDASATLLYPLDRTAGKEIAFNRSP
jgi:hypothetical protein